MAVRILLPIVWGLALALSALAQQDGEKDDAKQRLAEMRRIAELFQVQDADKHEVPLIEEPLLRFNDPTREFHDGSLWGFGAKGRPACLLSMEQYGGNWWFEMIALTTEVGGEPESLTTDAGPLQWRPKSAGISLQPLDGAPRPAAEAPRRLIQMKDQLRRLTAYEVGHTGTRYELRLMPQPVYRYRDAVAPVHDGAIFAFAYGTNPELLAILEAHGPDLKSSVWQIAFARCGSAEPHVLAGDKEIFTLPYATKKDARQPYWNFRHTFPPAGDAGP